jgi:fructose-1,6-bisphosphatase/inositol monophosphatase family enzyme
MWIVGKVWKSSETDEKPIEILRIYRKKQDAVDYVKECLDEEDENTFRYTLKKCDKDKIISEEKILEKGKWKRLTSGYFVVQRYYFE